MNNPDNVGGLPSRTKSVVDVMDGLKREYPIDWEILDFYVHSLENKIVELCRAAPAGSGEVEDVLKKCDSVLNDIRPISPCLTEQLERYFAEIRALLRKLQQGDNP